MVPVSVVIPLYNKAPYILRTLESMAAQTYSDFEVIVVNDGSTDDSEAVARQFQDKRVRIVSQANAGPGAARNRGVAEAAGELVAFCDADDEWLPHYLETAMQAFREDAGLAAFTQGYMEYPSGRSTEAMWRERGLRDGVQQVRGQSAETLHYMLVYMTPPSSVIRRDVVQKWGGFYENRCTFGEDSFLMLKILLCERVAFDLRAGIAVHREAGALSQNLTKARPMEPFLADPAQVEQVCPADLLPLLHELYALRAFKMACVLGVYGDWRKAAAVRAKFRVKGDYRIPWYTSSLVCSTPVGAVLGAAWRRLGRVR